MPRLFIGLAVPPAVGASLAASTAAALPEVAFRCYPAADLHVTLCFLGEFALASDPEATRLERALVDETRGLAAPELALHGVGVFPEEGAPRALWAGLREEPGTEGRLAALANRARDAALAGGWRPSGADRSRPFRPHVTLARPRGEAPSPAGPLARFAALRPRGAWVAAEVTLFESRPHEPAARYRPLAEVPLAVRPG